MAMQLLHHTNFYSPRYNDIFNFNLLNCNNQLNAIEQFEPVPIKTSICLDKTLFLFQKFQSFNFHKFFYLMHKIYIGKTNVSSLIGKFSMKKATKHQLLSHIISTLMMRMVLYIFAPI